MNKGNKEYVTLLDFDRSLFLSGTKKKTYTLQRSVIKPSLPLDLLPADLGVMQFCLGKVVGIFRERDIDATVIYKAYLSARTLMWKKTFLGGF